jgi:hypothetical protein
MKNTFISYASADLPIVEKICAHLEMRGIDCWMAPRDIMPGRDYAEEIIGGIEGAATTLLLLSEHSNQSMFVKREIERAVSKSKPVIPVRIQSVMPSASLEFFVSSAHWIDVWQEPIEPKMDLLASAIRGLTGGGSHKNKKFVSADDGEPCPPRDLSATHDVPPVALAWDSGNKDATRDDAIDSQRDDQRKRIKGQVFSPLKWSIVVAGILLFIVGYALLDEFPEAWTALPIHLWPRSHLRQTLFLPAGKIEPPSSLSARLARRIGSTWNPRMTRPGRQQRPMLSPARHIRLPSPTGGRRWCPS